MRLCSSRPVVLFTLALSLGATGFLQGCHSSSPPDPTSPDAATTTAGSVVVSSSGSPPAPSASTPAAAVATQVQTVTAPLNQTPQYALTSADLALLQAQGVLSAGDSATLSALVANQ